MTSGLENAAGSFHSDDVVDLRDGDKDGLFRQHFGGSLLEFGCILSCAFEVGGKRKRQVCIDQVNPIWNGVAAAIQIMSFEASHDGAAAKRIRELFLKRQK